jgi:hypothetical protein
MPDPRSGSINNYHRQLKRRNRTYVEVSHYSAAMKDFPRRGDW